VERKAGRKTAGMAAEDGLQRRDNITRHPAKTNSSTSVSKCAMKW
jgi:hypothetical protein